MTGLERLRELSENVSFRNGYCPYTDVEGPCPTYTCRDCCKTDVLSIADQIEHEHAQTVEDHEKQQVIIRDLQHERDEALKAAATSRLVAKELRTLAGAWDVYGIGGPLMALADKLEAHKVAEAPSVLAVVEEMERHISGVEGAEDSPVATWARELREVVGWPVRGEEDASKETCEYFGSKHCDCSTCKRLERSVKDCGTAKSHDLVRRAKALAEREVK